ncbi:MAG TPA: hypothetical protein VNY74_06805 [Edaphobacter sp.]|nr:hypothetical protein [Edaphobacter sp.]
MIRLISSKLMLPGLAAVLLLPVCPSTLSAQSTSKAATIISDAQAQSLLQLLAAQQNGGTALTAAQSQMLMQYLLSKSGSSASTALGTAQTQMMLQSIAAQSAAAQGHSLSAAKALPGQAPTVTMPAATAAPAAPAPALGDKKPGVVRIGITMPKAQIGQSAQGPSAGEPLRVMLVQYLAGPSVETVSIAALLPDQIEAEAKATQCDFLVYSNLSQKKPTGGMGFLKNASSMANMIPMVGLTNSVSGAIAASSATAAASQAATLSSGVKAKSDIILEYHMNAAGNTSPVLNTTLDAKATADGEDVITPLVEKEATAIMAEVSKKR